MRQASAKPPSRKRAGGGVPEAPKRQTIRNKEISPPMPTKTTPTLEEPAPASLPAGFQSVARLHDDIEPILAMLPVEPVHMQTELIRDRWHRYILGGEAARPSVTTIINHLVQAWMEFYVQAQAAEVVTNQAKRLEGPFASDEEMLRVSEEVLRFFKDPEAIKSAIRAHAADRADFGTKFHLIAERIALGQPVNFAAIDPKLRGRCELFFNFAQAHRLRPLMIEFPCLSDAHFYAGTADLLSLAEFQGFSRPVLCLMDYKTGDGGYVERKGKMEFYLEHGMQLNALAACDHYFDTTDMTKKPFPRPELLVTLAVKEDHIAAWAWPFSPQLEASFLAGLVHYHTKKAKDIAPLCLARMD